MYIHNYIYTERIKKVPKYSIQALLNKLFNCYYV